MRILALGIGKMGSALLKDLIRSHEVSEVVAGDIDIQRLRQYVNQLGSDKVKAEYIDVTDRKKLLKLMKGGFDVIANTLIREYNLEVTKAAISAGVDIVDIGSPPEVFGLDRGAKDAGVTIVPSCGLDPGIDRILEGYGARKLDRVEEIYMWCGGFPQKDTPGYNNPLRYKIAWYWTGAIRTNLGKVRILRDGEVVEVEKLTGPGNPESITFPEPIGECEAFYTGAPFDLIEHLCLKDTKNAWHKTVRWKGHCDMWTKLIALGLTSSEPLKVKGCEITPMEFWIELGNRMLQYEKGEGDLVVQRVHVAGEKSGEKTQCAYELIDFYDKENDVTAMGRTTAYPCSIVSQMIARGDVKEKGVVHAGKIGWNAELANKFFTELAKRNIRIAETMTQPLA
ncbi:MAG: Saccharopine dehydrogenase [Candidatus Bathyarchaeota archaeon BA1]|nr:MAG: Saccharopine dehydrogenase [Candidatus Bathyarchaeota archaeon BA1]